MVEGVGFEPTYAKRPDFKIFASPSNALFLMTIIRIERKVCHKVWKKTAKILTLAQEFFLPTRIVAEFPG